jgi:hypothetical protein
MQLRRCSSPWLCLAIAVTLTIAVSLAFGRINVLHSAVADPLFAIAIILALIAWGCRT